MGIYLESPGDFDKTRNFIKSIRQQDAYGDLDSVGARGVDALAAATPVETGLAQSSWYYIIKKEGSRITISWHNDDVEGGAVVVLLIQYGHGTGTGGYVAGRDFVNPAIKPVMEDAINEVWRKVVNA